MKISVVGDAAKMEISAFFYSAKYAKFCALPSSKYQPRYVLCKQKGTE
jgi:hypothetical protein